jgi:DNA polymerase-3 subunit delta'
VIGALLDALERGKLGHALLLCSAQESEDFESSMWALGMALLCLERQSGEMACGHCASCLLFSSIHDASELAHPDAVQLRPDTSKGYSVELVRQLIESFQLKRSLSPRRVVWIFRADELSAGGGAAANALLKLLEEPRPDSFLLLATRRPEAVLATIRSRCQIFRLPSPPAVEMQSLSNDLSTWGELADWLRQGAVSEGLVRVPADNEAYWSDRENALFELERLYVELWTLCRGSWGRLERGASIRILSFFSRFQRLLLDLKAFGNPSLQWLSFRSDVRLKL